MDKKSLWRSGILRIPFLLTILLIILPVSVKASDINVWYGNVQNFGQIGSAQHWVNILGNVSDPDGIQSLTYSLDGGTTEFNLSVGPDGRRLNDAGDFNVEIDFVDLAIGPNDVLIKATDLLNDVTFETVTVNKYSNLWPIPYSIDWSLETNIQDVAQIVDGLWTIDTDGVRSIQPGYDRILAIGDISWTDYEVSVPIKFNSIDLDAFDPDLYPYSVGPGIGVTLRWQGHVDADGSQPTWGWWKTGGSCWYEFYQDGQGELFSSGEGFFSPDPYSRTLGFDISYIWKMRVQTIAEEGSLYSFKVWDDSQEPEPQEWQMGGMIDLASEDYLNSGSFLLIAHHIDAIFGDVTVIPLEDSNIPVISDVDVTVNTGGTEATISWTTNVVSTGCVDYGTTGTYELGTVCDNSPETNHSITLTGLTPFTTYYYLITAVSENGGFVSKHIQQSFESLPSYTLTVTTEGSGSVLLDPDQLLYSYGQEVTLTANPDPWWAFTNWSGDLDYIDPQLRVEIGPDNSYVILENNQIKVTYEPFFATFDQFAIKNFEIKSAENQSQVGTCTHCYLGADSGRGALLSASVIYDGQDRKTVRLVWNERGDPTKQIIHEVSIFPGGKFLKIDYIDVERGLNVVDLGQPGGTNSGTHVAYGHSGWDRDYITHDESAYFGSYYNRYPPDGVNDPADGGSLNYNGNFIVGVYNPGNGTGFGRVMPVADNDIIKLLLDSGHRRGMEFFPHAFHEPHNPFTGYLYVFTEGEAEAISLGQRLADGHVNPIYPTDNPITITITEDRVITAHFEEDTDGDGVPDGQDLCPDTASGIPVDADGCPQEFIDVPPGFWAEEAIYKINNAGITRGCSQDPLKYCPDAATNREQMAVFLGRGIHGSEFTPPEATGIFDDVSLDHWAADWIEQAYNDGITKGCSTNPLRYCPGVNVTRAQMAVFLLRAKHGDSYTPPTATGIFDDVDLSHWAADWIEQLYQEGITVGCGTDPLRYCPDSSVTRAQMAVFLMRTFDL